jgi:hypothetical protein
MASAPVQLDEEGLIREQIAQIDLPEGVRLKSIEPASEWTGEPAWRLSFSLSRRIPLTDKRLSELSRMKDSLMDRIFALRLGKWPFVHFKGVK